MTELDHARVAVRAATLADEAELLRGLEATARLDEVTRAAVSRRAAGWVRRVREDASPGLMETFLAEYGLSTDEGIALMCLAEALLRVPDGHTIDALIEDKIAPSDWGRHLGRSSSSLVNASTWALLLTGRVLADDGERGVSGALRGALRRLGEPVIRVAVGEAMRRLGRQFVLGETIEEAMRRAADMEEGGYTYSYDMLGEAARTHDDAARYRVAYEDATSALAERADPAASAEANPGISIKLSALHPRYETAHRETCVPALVEVVRGLARQAARANLGLNIDAEEQDRLDLSLDVIERVTADPALAGWEGFGVVVQAYGRRALPVVDWLDALARSTGRRIMVRLVKGAYWDSEIKRAQVVGIESFPVFTRKAGSDVSFLACARALLDRAPWLYPQFATHNAHTVAAVLAMAGRDTRFELQRLHGMGEALHEVVRRDAEVPCRIYAPVGAHEDLLAYLVRRLLENGANSSFANQIVDARLSAEAVARDPFAALGEAPPVNRRLRQPPELFGQARRNAAGWDLADPVGLAAFEAARAPWREATWHAEPLTAIDVATQEARSLVNPARPDDVVGTVAELEPSAAQQVVDAAAAGVGWAAPDERARMLRRAADVYEAHAGEVFALVAREAGKTPADAVAELREAVDFLRYYAGEAERLAPEPAGVALAIAPWNFPLAIFTGEVAAALAAGNAVVAKPAEQTPLVAVLATRLLHDAGVPRAALQLAPGGGAVGAALASCRGIAAVAFTGSMATARSIDRALAEHSPDAVLVAETGGLNAMIVDSTALPEQAVRDILASAFQSAGQRCSALRMLYVQRDVAGRVMTMLRGAMATLSVGDPWHPSTDVGPVIDAAAKEAIDAHLVAHGVAPSTDGLFVPPTVIELDGIEALDKEVFGPVLHVATFEAHAIDDVVAAVNAKGYGLTFGLHSRIDDRVEAIVSRVRVGNIYVNRNQVGAVVGSQPFGGEGLSGTGPKAGGPHIVARLSRRAVRRLPADRGPAAQEGAVQRALTAARPTGGVLSVTDLPGPTGESNRLSTVPRGTVLCLGPTLAQAEAQARAAAADGNATVVVAPRAAGPGTVSGILDPEALTRLAGIDAVAFEGEDVASVRRALAAREGPILPVVAATDEVVLERHLCIDTAAAGGNARLMSSTEDDVAA